MRPMKTLFLLALVSLALPAGVSADGRRHRHAVCAGLVTGGTFDNVVVPPGATCFLSVSTVRGNVKALRDSILIVESSTVNGNIEGDKAGSVQVIDSTVGGNIQISEAGHPDFTSALVLFSSVLDGNIQIEKGRFPFGDWVVSLSVVDKGNIKVKKNSTNSDFVSGVVDNTVAQNVQVSKNTGPGSKSVIFNIVGKNLQCKKNEEPFIGGPNTARKAKGQCF